MNADRKLLWPNDPPPGHQIQILSDLHLEVGQQYSSYNFPVAAPLLVLAGDIGRLIDYDGYLYFLKAQVARYQRVFLVLGNHEFYGSDHASTIDAAQRLVKEPTLLGKVVLLHRSGWVDPNDGSLTILGCTLWSHIPKEARETVTAKVGDYKNITGWTTDIHNQEHAEDVAWLRKRVTGWSREEDSNTTKAKTTRSLLVVTHHAPCLEGTSRPEHSNNPWTSAFATELLIAGQRNGGWPGIHTWVFGHTHFTTNFMRDGIRVVANQRGYVLPGSEAQRLEKVESVSKSRKKGPHEFDVSRTIQIQ